MSVVFFSIGIFLIAFTCGCSSDESTQDSDTRTVEVTRGTLEVTGETSGHIEMPDQTNVAFEVGGTVDEVHVELGDEVKKGQKLAELETASLERSVEQAQTNLEDAWENLSQAGPDARSLEAARNQLKRAQIALEDARDKLEKAELTAPFGGEIARVMVKEGNQVAIGTVAFLLIDPSKVEVIAQIDEIDISEVERGQEATITLDALPGMELSGEVAAISRAGESVSGVVTYETKLTVDDPPASLRSGMTCTAEITTQRKEDVLLVSTLAIKYEEGKSVVKVVGPEGKTETREVEIGLQTAEQTEIKEGLQEGDKVLVESVERGGGGFGF
ncbi:MAG: efflux RND transporter periplasmic adaptor subunit [Dehalococcoidia bacterium]